MADNPYGFTSDPTNILLAGGASWVVKKSGDTGAYNLGPITDLDVSVESVAQELGDGTENVGAVSFQAKAKMLYTGKADLLAGLDTFTTWGLLNHGITGIGGKTYVGYFGLVWELVCDGEMDKNRYIELTADEYVLVDHATYPDMTNLLTDPVPTGTPAEGDELYAAFNGAATGTPTPAGLLNFDLKRHTDTAYEGVGAVTNVKFHAKIMSTRKDGRMRSIAFPFVDVNIEVDLMQTADEQGFLDEMALDLNSYKLTFAGDGAVFTAATGLGVHWTLKETGNAANERLITLRAKGKIALATFIGLWS